MPRPLRQGERDMTDQPLPEQIIADFVRLLSVERKDASGFTGMPQPGGVGRVFGGQVIAQALQAAQGSVEEGKSAHSLHAYFLRGGREGEVIDYAVTADFEGRSFANRRVVASQQGEPILNFSASFHREEAGLEHQAPAMPDVAPPEDLPPEHEQRAGVIARFGDRMTEGQRALFLRARPIEMRTPGQLHWMNSDPKPPMAHSWFRTVAPLPDDLALHRAVIAYASDYTLLGTSVLPHGLSWFRGELTSASLDHALWFHRPVRADEWLLYATDSPWSGGGRGFNRGSIFNRAGELVASVAQEGMIRRRRKD